MLLELQDEISHSRYAQCDMDRADLILFSTVGSWNLGAFLSGKSRIFTGSGAMAFNCGAVVRIQSCSLIQPSGNCSAQPPRIES